MALAHVDSIRSLGPSFYEAELVDGWSAVVTPDMYICARWPRVRCLRVRHRSARRRARRARLLVARPCRRRRRGVVYCAERRGRGIGRALSRFAEARAREQGAPSSPSRPRWRGSSSMAPSGSSRSGLARCGWALVCRLACHAEAARGAGAGRIVWLHEFLCDAVSPAVRRRLSPPCPLPRRRGRARTAAHLYPWLEEHLQDPNIVVPTPIRVRTTSAHRRRAGDAARIADDDAGRARPGLHRTLG